jgi:hypothetical protein
MNRFDFFQENSYILNQEKVNHEFGLGFGINKSIFQKRINPELFYCLQSKFQFKSRFQFQLHSSYHINFYNVNRQNTEIHYFNEILFGFVVTYGETNKVGFSPQIGLISENFKSDYLDKQVIHINYSYSAKLFFSHAF